MSSLHQVFPWANFRTAKIFFALLVSCCLPALADGKSTPTHPSTTAEVIDKVSMSLVRVDAWFSYQIEGEPAPQLWKSSGTGFIIDRESRIATANHVVSAALNQRLVEQSLVADKNPAAKKNLVPGSFHAVGLTIVIVLPNVKSDIKTDYGNTESFGGSILAHDDTLDIAILSCKTNLITTRSADLDIKDGRSVAEFQKDAPRHGDPVTIIGFPGIIVGNQLQQIPGPTTNSGTVSNPFFVDEHGRYVILLDLRANHGDSGGPAFNTLDGRVIGFVDEGYAASDGQYSGLMSIIPIDKVLDLVPKQ